MPTGSTSEAYALSGSERIKAIETVVETVAGAVPWVNALDAVTAAVGLATLNALIEVPPNALEADVRELIRVRPGDVVAW